MREENKFLQKMLNEFSGAADYKCDNADDAIRNLCGFYRFLEEHESVKVELYRFAYELIKNYVFFIYHNEPSKAYMDSDCYMAEFKKDQRNTAHTFFNFGGFGE